MGGEGRGREGKGGGCDPPALADLDKGSVIFSPPGRRGEEIAGQLSATCCGSTCQIF